MTLIKPKEIIAIYDNSKTDSASVDCMTFVLKSKFNACLNDCLGTSYNAVSFSQFSGCQNGTHLGDKVDWTSISTELRTHVIGRLDYE